MYIRRVNRFATAYPWDYRAISAELARFSSDRFRQANISTLGAVLSAVHCVDTYKLDPQMPILMATDFGSLTDSLATLLPVYDSHELPKPVSFIGTLQNTTGWYVAKTLGLTGPQQTLSCGENPVCCLLDMAMIEKNALVGCVEEAGFDSENHLDRTVRADWMLLSSDPRQATAKIERCEYASLAECVDSLSRSGVRVFTICGGGEAPVDGTGIVASDSSLLGLMIDSVNSHLNAPVAYLERFGDRLSAWILSSIKDEV